MKEPTKRDYSPTLQLPRTDFSMRANLLTMEPLHQKRWEQMGLYQRVRESSHPLGPFVIHDGPPYANGPIHMGHLLNKILKDLVVRSRMMFGYDVEFVPGWDCHGLPIEHRVLKELGEEAARLETVEVRHRCRDYASHYVTLQAEQMKRLGTLAKYEDPYRTMDPDYEAAVLDVFGDLVNAGIVYRDVKPVHWSIANQTALAEAELEYFDRTDTSIYVNFEIANSAKLPPSLGLPQDQSASLMIWTTTPWTLPANMVVAVAPQAEYSLYRYSRNGQVCYTLMASRLAEEVGEIAGVNLEQRGSCLGQELVEEAIHYRHPFVDRVGRLVIADYVTLEDGTGLVHTAPGHGADDYYTGVRENIPVYCPVQGDGTFDETVPDWLVGKDVWTANDLIVEDLRATGHLFFDQEYQHSYPHDWRSKTPTIFRATEQWFVAVDLPFGKRQQPLRERGLDAARQSIRFIPSWGKARLEGMLEARPDWCISRQRAWGLPIPAFLAENNQVLLTPASVAAVAAQVRQHGSDFWFEAAASQLLNGYDLESDPDAPEWLREQPPLLEELQKCEDIFDVWFESGSSWNAVLRGRGVGYPSDLYLEGSDQHRGWFQLSLLPALGVTEESPFRAVLTHGFMVDAAGHKMSKSMGNALEVEDVLKQHGADICRWWVSSLNYTNDIKVDWEYFKVASEEYRKVRNTIRFLLGNLNDFDPDQDRYSLGEADDYSLDSWAYQELASFVRTIRRGYRQFQFKLVSEAIFNFCNETLSAVYLAAVKDRLYCDSANEPRRRRTQTVLYEIAHALIRASAPILVHTAEEAWLALLGKSMEGDSSVHLANLPEELDWEAAPNWSVAMSFRQQVLKALEASRVQTGIKNPLDMGVRAMVEPELFQALEAFLPELTDLCGVSRFELESGEDVVVQIQDLREQPRCERSWKRDTTVRMRSDGGMLSDRDAAVLGLERA